MPAGMSAGMVALIAWAALLASVAIVRSVAVIAMLSIAAVAAGIAACAIDPPSSIATCVLSIGGLAAGGVGVALVRTMIERSVSLTMLIAVASKERSGNVDPLIAGRIDEAAFLRLTRCREGRYELTRLGRAILGCAAAADRALGRSR